VNNTFKQGRSIAQLVPFHRQRQQLEQQPKQKEIFITKLVITMVLIAIVKIAVLMLSNFVTTNLIINPIQNT
jgi:hypothetical protein